MTILSRVFNGKNAPGSGGAGEQGTEQAGFDTGDKDCFVTGFGAGYDGNPGLGEPQALGDEFGQLPVGGIVHGGGGETHLQFISLQPADLGPAGTRLDMDDEADAVCGPAHFERELGRVIPR